MLEQKKIEILFSIFGEPQYSGNELLFYCPKCRHHKKKLSINVSKNSFKCWVCDYRGSNIYRLIKRHANFTQKQNWLSLDCRVDLSTTKISDIFPENNIVEQTIDLPKEFITLTGKTGNSAIPALKYLFERGVTRNDILQWKIGYCPDGEYAGRIIIPSFNLNGKCNYFIARSYRGDWLRYKNPPLQRNNVIFNHLYIDWDNDVILTEGVFDAIVAGNAVPLLGSTLGESSKLFAEIIKYDTAVYLALDPDAESKSKTLIRDMMKYGIELYKIDVSGYKDVGNMTREEFILRKNNAMQMTGQNYLRYEIQGII